MGPALRLTPLSPAVGPEGRFTPGVWMPAQRPLRELELASVSPGARAGAGSVGGRDRSRGPVPCRPAVPRPYFVGLGLIAALALPESSTNSSAPGRQIWPSDFAPSDFNGLGFGLHQDEPLCAPLLIPPSAASRRRVEAVPKSLLPRRLFSLCLGRANPRLDDWKVRGAADSGKRGNVQLSTFGLNTSGQQWITQQFAAI